MLCSAGLHTALRCALSQILSDPSDAERNQFRSLLIKSLCLNDISTDWPQMKGKPERVTRPAERLWDGAGSVLSAHLPAVTICPICTTNLIFCENVPTSCHCCHFKAIFVLLLFQLKSFCRNVISIFVFVRSSTCLKTQYCWI